MAAFRAVLPDPFESERENIALAARSLTGTIVQPGETFSQNETLGPYTEEKGYCPGPNYSGGKVVIGTGGGVCKISSMLYNLTVLSDLPIVSRREHSMLVPYVPPGQDATVSYSGGVDYRFRNDTDGPILIWGEMIDDTLFMAFYGSRPAPRVEWQHDVLSRTEPTIERCRNPDLESGQSRVIFEGFEGITVQSRALITEPNGDRRTRDLRVSSYQMSPRVEEHAPQDKRWARVWVFVPRQPGEHYVKYEYRDEQLCKKTKFPVHHYRPTQKVRIQLGCAVGTF